MRTPLVSIILPTYSRPKTLSRAIDSCLKQTYKNIEIIVIDDNNPNTEYRKATEKLMHNLYKENKRVIYLKMEENGGACKARNKGIEESKGEYITFIDDDDEYLENNIEKEIEFILKNEYDMIFCDFMRVSDETGELTYYKYNKNFDLTKQSLLRKHLVDIISGGIAFMYKSSVLKKLGGFYDIPASQEYILLLNTIVAGYKIGYFEFTGVKAHIPIGKTRITGSKKAIEAKKEVLRLVKPHLHFLNFKDKRKVKFRLNAFIFIQYYRRKNLNSIIYGFKLLPYLDLLYKQTKNKPKFENNIRYF